jgi:hypothetical protein
MSVYDSFAGGTNFLDSITTGIFQAYGNATTGVPTGIPLLYSWKPQTSTGILETPQDNPNFANTGGAYVDLTPPQLSATFSVVNYEIPLDVCRTVSITANQSFTCFASCRDFYGNIMTFGGSSEVIETVNTFVAPRGLTALVSLKISGEAGVGDVQITTRDEVELPFADYNDAPLSVANYNGNPLLAIDAGSSTPYKAKPLYKILQANTTQTAGTGRVRPLFQFFDQGITDLQPSPFDGFRILVIAQNISGYGFNIPNKSGTAPAFAPYEKDPFLNWGQYVLGLPSYAENWKGWVQP